jgi:ribonuclease P protein component
MQRLLRRKDFLAAAKGRSRASQGVVVQMRPRGDDDPPRIGFTVTKKLGGAVIRNRIRRRLKEAVRTALAGAFAPGRDYVLIGRNGTASRDFGKLVADIRGALDYLHKDQGQNRPAQGGS